MVDLGVFEGMLTNAVVSRRDPRYVDGRRSFIEQLDVVRTLIGGCWDRSTGAVPRLVCIVRQNLYRMRRPEWVLPRHTQWLKPMILDQDTTWNWHTHTHPFNGPLSWTTRVSRYQKGETNLDFTEARDSEWQWYQLGHMQICTSLQTDIHASTPPLSFLQTGCPSCRPTNSVKALNWHQ